MPFVGCKQEVLESCFEKQEVNWIESFQFEVWASSLVLRNYAQHGQD